MGETENIKKFMQNIVLNYNNIRGKHRNEEKYVFWDAVIVSALDETQLKAYEMQIAAKQKRLELPLDVPFHVFSDPPRCKIGCGGSAMYVMEKLAKIYGDSFQEMHILFVPAGGYSQRLPSWSVLGKLFSPVPLMACPMFQMLDLILAVYLPFLEKMSPGVFLASSDAIISYYMDEKDIWSFHNRGFTALAHPSSLSVAMHHGVYVLNVNNSENYSFMSDCIQVLQKPSEQKMRDEGAIIKDFSPGCSEKSEIVYSDSAFFFDMQVALKLIKFYKHIQPLHTEISSYGDFLQPLGLSSNPYYIRTCDKAHSIKLQLYELLHGTPLSVLVLRHSTFHHLGTMPEYIQNYNCESEFMKHFPSSNFVWSFFCEKNVSHHGVKGLIIHSSVHPESKIPSSTIVEYCNFKVPLEIGVNSIISNCKLHMSLHTVHLKLPVTIPSNVLIHTIAVNNGFVTVCFATTDDIKKLCDRDDAQNLLFLNKKLGILLNKFKNHTWFDPKSQSVSLWDAKIFCVCQSMDDSFIHAINLINFVMNCDTTNSLDYRNVSYFSMKDIIISKNVEKMLGYQNELLITIQNEKRC